MDNFIAAGEEGGLSRGGLINLDVICILEIHKETKISKHWRLWMIVRLIIEYLLFDVIKNQIDSV